MSAESREMSNGGSSDRSSGKDYGSCTDGKCIKRTTQEITSGMWFGPRLGRRRRSDEKPEMGPKTIEALANVLDSARWALIKIPGRNRDSLLERESRIELLLWLRLLERFPTVLSHRTYLYYCEICQVRTRVLYRKILRATSRQILFNKFAKASSSRVMRAIKSKETLLNKDLELFMRLNDIVIPHFISLKST